MTNAEAISFAALWSSNHQLRIMVNRGLVSPDEVDELYGSIIEAVQTGGDPAFAALIEQRMEGAFAEMRQWAEKLWVGKGDSFPR